MDDSNPSMTTVHNFPFPQTPYESTGTIYEVEMPHGAKVLGLSPQGVYALVDTAAPKVTRQFFVISTGKPIARAELLRFIATPAQGRHVFEVVESSN